MILEFTRPYSINLKHELFKQAHENKDNDTEFAKVMRVIEAMGWSEEYLKYEDNIDEGCETRTL